MEVETPGLYDTLHNKGRVEYITASEATKEATWLQQLTADFSAKSRTDHPAPTLYYDSQSTSHLIRNRVYHAKTNQTYRGEISLYLGVCHREEARSSERRYKGEHRRQPDEATPRSTLRGTKETYGTTTGERERESRIGQSRRRTQA